LQQREHYFLRRTFQNATFLPCLFFGQNFDLASVAMIPMKKNQNWLQAKYESNFLIISFYIFGYTLEPCI
jgi:hypothetical protein